MTSKATKRFLLAGAVLMATLPARADVPPPPDDYSGPPSVHVAGLVFEHRELQRMGSPYSLGQSLHDSNPLDWGGRWVILTGCDAGHPNCTLIKRKGAIGAAVSSVNGVDVSDKTNGDAGALAEVFAKTRKGKIKLTLLVATGDEPPRPLKTITMSVSPR